MFIAISVLPQRDMTSVPWVCSSFSICSINAFHLWEAVVHPHSSVWVPRLWSSALLCATHGLVLTCDDRAGSSMARLQHSCLGLHTNTGGTLEAKTCHLIGNFTLSYPCIRYLAVIETLTLRSLGFMLFLCVNYKHKVIFQCKGDQ